MEHSIDGAALTRRCDYDYGMTLERDAGDSESFTPQRLKLPFPIKTVSQRAAGGQHHHGAISIDLLCARDRFAEQPGQSVSEFFTDGLKAGRISVHHER